MGIEMEINVMTNEMPKLSKEQKKKISRVTNRYMRIRTNRVKRNVISFMSFKSNTKV